MQDYDLAVVIGRFQPFHNGHFALINEAHKIAENVLVMVGSCDSPRSIRNPFRFQERANMIRSACLRHPGMESWLGIVGISDHFYNDEGWLDGVQTKINTHIYDEAIGPRVVIVGHDKDSTSYYLKLFPQYDTVNIDNHMGIDATTIREAYFKAKRIGLCDLPDSTYEFLTDFQDTKAYDDLVLEFDYIEQYKQDWSEAPYPPTFVTVDAVVVCSGHVLLIRRKDAPGKGLLALPGGFLDPSETLLEGAVRELIEETRLKMPARALQKPDEQHVFDHPQRSMRGRTITHGFFFHLEPGKLPEVRGGSDASEAMWVPLSDLDPENMFEDHIHIIRHFVR